MSGVNAPGGAHGGAPAEVKLILEESPFNGGRFMGWGAHMCWWANRVGYSKSLVDHAMRLFYSEEGLGLDIARYNLGGGDDPAHDHVKRSDAAVPGYAKGFDAEGNLIYDWTADQNQRNVILAVVATNPDVYVEGFSNSPPYFMTESGCTGGSITGYDNNLKPEHYADFAEFIAECAKRFKEEWGVEFKSYSPMNEPDTDFWKAHNNKQEGCHYDRGEVQSQVILATRGALDRKGLTGVRVAVSEETNVDHQLRNVDLWSPEALAAVGKINTHTYGGTKREEMRAKAAALGKNLWMSEVDNGNVAGADPGNMGAALNLANRIILDLNGLQSSAWIIWDIIDIHRDAASTFRGEKDRTLDQNAGIWGVGMANHDTGKIELTQKYYAYGQFTRYINPGDTLIRSTDERSLAAYNKDTGAIKIVTVNTEGEAVTKRYDLSALGRSGKKARVIRTAGAFDGGEHWADKGAVDIADQKFACELPPNSITTFIIDA